MTKGRIKEEFGAFQALLLLWHEVVGHPRSAVVLQDRLNGGYWYKCRRCATLFRLDAPIAKEYTKSITGPDGNDYPLSRGD